jgi:hypothetical protein
MIFCGMAPWSVHLIHLLEEFYNVTFRYDCNGEYHTKWQVSLRKFLVYKKLFVSKVHFHHAAIMSNSTRSVRDHTHTQYDILPVYRPGQNYRPTLSQCVMGQNFP